MQSNMSVFGAIAVAIKALASFLIDLITVGREATAMAEAAVKTAREQQAVRLAVDMSDFAVITVAKASVDQAKVHESVNKYIEGNKEREALVLEARTRLTKDVNEVLTRLKAERGANQ